MTKDGSLVCFEVAASTLPVLLNRDTVRQASGTREESSTSRNIEKRYAEDFES